METVCVCVWTRIVCIFKKAPLSDTQHSRTDGKQQAARDNTVVLHWLGEGGGGGWRRHKRLFFSEGGGSCQGARCPSKASSHPLHPPPSSLLHCPKNKRRRSSNLNICVSLGEGPPNATNPPTPSSSTPTHTHTHLSAYAHN